MTPTSTPLNRQDRNRKLAAERTRLQREVNAAAERASVAEGELAAAQRQVARQSDLIASLEEDLLSAGGRCASSPELRLSFMWGVRYRSTVMLTCSA